MRRVRQESRPICGFDSEFVQSDGKRWEGIAYEIRAVVEYEGGSKADGFVEGQLFPFAGFSPGEVIDCQLVLRDRKGRLQYEGSAELCLPVGGDSLRFMCRGGRGALVSWHKRQPDKYRLPCDSSE